MPNKSISQIITHNYASLTAVEKTIADYFISTKTKEDFSSKTIKNKLFISESSLSRFAQKCGFRGYREFIYCYEQSIEERTSDLPVDFQVVFNDYHEITAMCHTYFDDQQVHDVVELMREAKRILIVGAGSSALAGKDIGNRFMRIGASIEVVSDLDEIRMKSVLQNEDTLMIGISISGNKEDVLFGLLECHKRGGRTVLVTANEELSGFYTKILVPTTIGLSNGSSITPQFPILLFFDLCFQRYLLNDTKQKLTLHNQTLDALKR
ncbi:MAG: MurR/RpiR family transcriptional regulator [Eubacteriales bacterium]